MSAARRREDSDQLVNAALQSSERVKQHAKRVTNALTNRKERAQTNPFEKVEFNDEDSLVTSIEAVIASAKKE